MFLCKIVISAFLNYIYLCCADHNEFYLCSYTGELKIGEIQIYFSTIIFFLTGKVNS